MVEWKHTFALILHRQQQRQNETGLFEYRYSLIGFITSLYFTFMIIIYSHFSSQPQNLLV